MVAYNLAHLTQPDDQQVGGPIQDDEALFLFALVRGMRLRRILEVGGLNGYSARNFLEAMGPEGMLYTVDLQPVPSLATNHRPIMKDVATLTATDLDGSRFDLVFFDAHAYVPQMDLLMRLRTAGLMNDETVLALHDTNLHPTKTCEWAYPIEEGWVHQDVERRMVNDLRRMGYDGFSLHPSLAVHDAELPVRHGVTIMRKFRHLGV